MSDSEVMDPKASRTQSLDEKKDVVDNEKAGVTTDVRVLEPGSDELDVGTSISMLAGHTSREALTLTRLQSWRRASIRRNSMHS